MVCRKALTSDVHEIARGVGREASLDDPRILLAVCRPCHDKLDDSLSFPITSQVAIAVAHYIESCCLAVCEAKGWAATAVTAEEVALELELYYGVGDALE